MSNSTSTTCFNASLTGRIAGIHKPPGSSTTSPAAERDAHTAIGNSTIASASDTATERLMITSIGFGVPTGSGW
ncbi:hypothetical protein D3C71_2186520 [compost metagenome]